MTILRGCLVLGILLAGFSPARAEGPVPEANIPPTDPPVSSVSSPQKEETPIHFGNKNADGWYVAESANFRIYHAHPRAFIRQVASAAERARESVEQHWFGKPSRPWDYRCELYLYPNGKAPPTPAGFPGRTPGYSHVRFQSGRVATRTIEIRGDVPGLLDAVLPHEVAHVALAGQFGTERVPPWADEGMAVLAEPRDRIDHHLHRLTRYRDRLFDLRALMEMDGYPTGKTIDLFYAQSVSLVDFLVEEKGTQVFAQFMRDGVQHGYKDSLRRHYGYRDYGDLRATWMQHAFPEKIASPVITTMTTGQAVMP